MPHLPFVAFGLRADKNFRRFRKPIDKPVGGAAGVINAFKTLSLCCRSCTTPFDSGASEKVMGNIRFENDKEKPVRIAAVIPARMGSSRFPGLAKAKDSTKNAGC